MALYQFTLPANQNNPFTPKNLPLICHLIKIGFHKYNNPWAKRIGKKIGRLIFDVGYHILGLAGNGKATIKLSKKSILINFDGRQMHYANIFMKHYRESYEPDVSGLLSVLLTDTRVFFDIGSNWGYFSFFAASLDGFSGPIHAFEPSSSTYGDLIQLVQQIGVSDRIECHQLALSNKTGEGYLYNDEFDSGLNSLSQSENPININLHTKTALREIDKLNRPFADVLKIDAENHEYQVLEGGTRLITEHRPFIILENWYSSDTEVSSLRPLQLLTDLNYTLFYPTWSLDDKLSNFDHKAYPKILGAKQKKIVYRSFQPDERSALVDQVNVFACPNNRLNKFLDINFPAQ